MEIPSESGNPTAGSTNGSEEVCDDDWGIPDAAASNPFVFGGSEDENDYDYDPFAEERETVPRAGHREQQDEDHNQRDGTARSSNDDSGQVLRVNDVRGTTRSTEPIRHGEGTASATEEIESLEEMLTKVLATESTASAPEEIESLEEMLTKVLETESTARFEETLPGEYTSRSSVPMHAMQMN